MRASASSATNEAHRVDLHVGEQVRRRRVVAKISQTEIGENLGVSFQQVQKYERGSNRISAGRLYQLSKLFNVGVNAFFKGLDGKSRERLASYDELQAIVTFATSREGLALCRAYLAAPSSASRKLAFSVLQLGSDDVG